MVARCVSSSSTSAGALWTASLAPEAAVPPDSPQANGPQHDDDETDTLDAADKRKSRRQHIRGLKREKTWQELKALKNESKRRATERKARPARKRDWLEGSEQESPNKDTMGQRRNRPRQKPAGPKAPVPDLEGCKITAEGLVVEVVRGGAKVLCAEQQLFVEAHPRRDELPELVVGDRVLVEPLGGTGARLLDVLARQTWLSRPDPACPGRERLIAVNVDKAVIVVSVVAPVFKPGLVDRYLVALRRGGIDPVVAINKADRLPGDQERSRIASQLAHHGAAGVPLIWVSAQSGEGLSALGQCLAGCTAVFVGQSGVGKSSLLNAIDPDGQRRTGEERSKDGKGRHTTTGSRLVTLAEGTRLVDTPGVRAFGLWAADRDDLSAAFPDLALLSADCRFHDCQHDQEPGCAVQAAVARGSLDPARLSAWTRLIASLE